MTREAVLVVAILATSRILIVGALLSFRMRRLINFLATRELARTLIDFDKKLLKRLCGANFTFQLAFSDDFVAHALTNGLVIIRYPKAPALDAFYPCNPFERAGQAKPSQAFFELRQSLYQHVLGDRNSLCMRGARHAPRVNTPDLSGLEQVVCPTGFMRITCACIHAKPVFIADCSETPTWARQKRQYKRGVFHGCPNFT